MALGGTASYRTEHGFVPDLVTAAVRRADRLGFELSSRPEIGRLLALLAGGLPPGSIIGETGTGTGVGLAWMVSSARDDVRFVSYELDAHRAGAAQEVFADRSNVTIVHGDSAGLYGHGPFDLLVHDGGPGSGKARDDLVDPAAVLRPGGTMTVDDYTPTITWPPRFEGGDDVGRLRVLTHPALRATEIRVAPDLAVLVARYLPE